MQHIWMCSLSASDLGLWRQVRWMMTIQLKWLSQFDNKWLRKASLRWYLSKDLQEGRRALQKRELHVQGHVPRVAVKSKMAWEFRYSRWEIRKDRKRSGCQCLWCEEVEGLLAGGREWARKRTGGWGSWDDGGWQWQGEANISRRAWPQQDRGHVSHKGPNGMCVFPSQWE